MVARRLNTRLIKIGPQGLEDLVRDRLNSSGIPANSIGRVNTPDGGVDIIARLPGPADCLMAVQIESHDAWKKRTGLAKTQRLGGVVDGELFSFGLLVTNTGFTSNALAYLENVSNRLRRAAYEELCQWLVGNLLTNPTLESRLPREIEIPGGPRVKIPPASILDRNGQPLCIPPSQAK